MTETQKHQERYAFLRDRISCGWFHIAGVLDDGTVKACGNNEAQQCEVADWTDIVKIKCGPLRTVGLRKDGTVLSTKGDVFTGGRIPGEGIEKFTDVIDIACGTFHTVGLRRDGTVIACGFNDDGQCNVDGWTNVKNIYAANNHTIALCNDGSLLYCGRCDGGSLHFNGVSAAKKLYCGLNDTVIVTADDKVYRTDFESETPILINIKGDEIAHVEFNVDHFIILKTNGTLLHFGSEEDGRGDVSNWTGILDISCSKKVSAGFTTDIVYLTGTNGTRKLELKGVATQIESENVTGFVTKGGKVTVLENGTGEVCGSFQLFDSLPVQTNAHFTMMESAKEVEFDQCVHKAGIAWEHYQKYNYLRTRVAGGLAHTVGVMYNGQVRACGANGMGQCNVGNWTNIVQIACGAGATVGLKKDGSICFAGQVPFNTDDCSASGTHPSKWPNNVKSVSGCLHSHDHIVGLLEDGKVIAYGCNEDNQCDVAHWCDIIEICVQPSLTLGIRKDGTVVTAGKNTGIKDIVSQWKNIEHLYAGNDKCSLVGLCYDGTVVSTSNDKNFDVSKWQNVIDISVGSQCIVGITGAGHVYFTGNLPQNMKEQGLDGCLCIGADALGMIVVSQSNDTKLYQLNKGEAFTGNLGVGLLIYQTGFAHKIFVQRNGGVHVEIPDLMADFKAGQDDTDDWALTKPITTESNGTTSTGGSNTSSQTSSGGCYVATCVYGSYDCPQVWTLRRYRDETLGSTWYGRCFIRTYYAISPTLVKWFGNTSWFKRLWRGKLDRLVAELNNKGVDDTPYEDKNW